LSCAVITVARSIDSTSRRSSAIVPVKRIGAM
jgi:hypothetical protein